MELSLTSKSWPKSVPCGRLTIHVFYHSIPSYDVEVDCWTYLSEGMSDVGQPELVITIRRRPQEPEHEYSREPFEWFKVVYSWGKSKRILDIYHTHELHSEHWLGSKHLETVTHGMPIELPGLAQGVLPWNRVHGITLTNEEATIAKAFGYTRVIAHYGISQRWFPYVPWIDRDREDCITLAQMEASMRNRRFIIKKIRGLSVRWEGDYFILKIPLGRELDVKAAVQETRPEQAWGFDSCLHPDANCCFYWESGQKDMRVYGECETTGCRGLAFIVFCPQQPAERWNILEDGCTMFLSDPIWLDIRDALCSQRDIQVQVKNKIFCVEFSHTTYQDPVTGSQYDAEGGEFRTYYPKERQPIDDSHIQVESTILLNMPDPDLVSGEDVAEYIEVLVAELKARIPVQNPRPDLGQGKLLYVTIELPPTHEDWLSVSVVPSADGLDMQEICNEIAKMPKPHMGAVVNFQVIFGLWGGKRFDLEPQSDQIIEEIRDEDEEITIVEL